jgi:hypothetical protein
MTLGMMVMRFAVTPPKVAGDALLMKASAAEQEGAHKRLRGTPSAVLCERYCGQDLQEN